MFFNIVRSRHFCCRKKLTAVDCSCIFSFTLSGLVAALSLGEGVSANASFKPAAPNRSVYYTRDGTRQFKTDRYSLLLPCQAPTSTHVSWPKSRPFSGVEVFDGPTRNLTLGRHGSSGLHHLIISCCLVSIISFSSVTVQ